MDRYRVLVVCGSGASSAFMAIALRKAIAERGLRIEVRARSEADIENYVDEIDAVMVGPHLSVYYDTLKERYLDQVPVILMRSDYYSTMDGHKALDHLLSETGWE
ncbi:MAG: PTS sugar transporter subunit IIB [Solobacterium sp.]|nr:PTS sugar transporter subunit IIB [Solobacterium sp.]